jgi:uncharacterized membrane protein YbaN (DUF454 family)
MAYLAGWGTGLFLYLVIGLYFFCLGFLGAVISINPYLDTPVCSDCQKDREQWLQNIGHRSYCGNADEKWHSCEKIYKISEGKKPNVLDLLVERKINFVFNTPNPSRIITQALTDGYLIRRKAVEFGIPIITNLELVDSLANALRNHIVFEID